MKSRNNILAASAIAAAASLSHQAIGAEKTDGLPGVQSGRTIVQPAAEPDNMPAEAQSPYGPGFVKVGDSWVRISGRIRYDIDFSTGKASGSKSEK